MAQASFDVILATRRLQDAGFGADQAEAVVQAVTQANSLTLQMVQDLADLKAHVTENMVTKAYLAETLSQYDLKNMATRSELKDMVSRAHFDETVAQLATKHDIRDMVTKHDIRDMVTKHDIRDMATKADIRGFVTKAEFEKAFAQLYRHLLFGSLGLASLLIAAIKFL